MVLRDRNEVRSLGKAVSSVRRSSVVVRVVSVVVRGRVETFSDIRMWLIVFVYLGAVVPNTN